MVSRICLNPKAICFILNIFCFRKQSLSKQPEIHINPHPNSDRYGIMTDSHVNGVLNPAFKGDDVDTGKGGAQLLSMNKLGDNSEKRHTYTVEGSGRRNDGGNTVVDMTSSDSGNDSPKSGSEPTVTDILRSHEKNKEKTRTHDDVVISMNSDVTDSAKQKEVETQVSLCPITICISLCASSHLYLAATCLYRYFCNHVCSFQK